MNKECISQEDLPKARRLAQLDMKRMVPVKLTENEKNERADLVIEFNSKYPTWQKGYNFITGEILH